MKNLTILTIAVGMAALPATADTQLFRGIVGDAANIESVAGTLAENLKNKRFDSSKLAVDVERLGAEIAKLRQDVETFDASALSGPQQADWKLVKTKVELLTIFHDRKAELMKGDVAKNRALLRSHAKGIATRARLLQQTANRLDR